MFFITPVPSTVTFTCMHHAAICTGLRKSLAAQLTSPPADSPTIDKEVSRASAAVIAFCIDGKPPPFFAICCIIGISSCAAFPKSIVAWWFGEGSVLKRPAWICPSAQSVRENFHESKYARWQRCNFFVRKFGLLRRQHRLEKKSEMAASCVGGIL